MAREYFRICGNNFNARISSGYIFKNKLYVFNNTCKRRVNYFQSSRIKRQDVVVYGKIAGNVSSSSIIVAFRRTMQPVLWRETYRNSANNAFFTLLPAPSWASRVNPDKKSRILSNVRVTCLQPSCSRVSD